VGPVDLAGPVRLESQEGLEDLVHLPGLVAQACQAYHAVRLGQEAQEGHEHN